MLNSFGTSLYDEPSVYYHRGYPLYIPAQLNMHRPLIRPVVDRVLQDTEHPGFIEYFNFCSTSHLRVKLRGIAAELELASPPYLESFLSIARRTLQQWEGGISSDQMQRWHSGWLEDFAVKDPKDTLADIEKVLFPEGKDKQREACAELAAIAALTNILIKAGRGR